MMQPLLERSEAGAASFEDREKEKEEVGGTRAEGREPTSQTFSNLIQTISRYCTEFASGSVRLTR